MRARPISDRRRSIDAHRPGREFGEPIGTLAASTTRDRARAYEPGKRFGSPGVGQTPVTSRTTPTTTSAEIVSNVIRDQSGLGRLPTRVALVRPGFGRRSRLLGLVRRNRRGAMFLEPGTRTTRRPSGGAQTLCGQIAGYTSLRRPDRTGSRSLHVSRPDTYRTGVRGHIGHVRGGHRGHVDRCCASARS